MEARVRQRVLFVTNAPAPYRTPLFARLAEHHELTVRYFDEPETGRGWRIPLGRNESWFGRRWRVPALGVVTPGVVGAVRRADVVVVGGYDQLPCAMAALVGRLLGRRVVMFFDGIAPSRLGRRGWRLRYKRMVTRLPHHHLVNGGVARRYFVDDLRVPAARISNQVLVPVDAPPAGSTDLLLDLAIDLPIDVLFVGRLIARKGAGEVVGLARRHPELSIVIAGDGPERAPLERASEGSARFLGAVDGATVAALMRAAACVAVPSVDEPWGLVVHEAISLDVPVLVGADMGCVEDLVVDGVNGVVLGASSIDALETARQQAIVLDREGLRACNDVRRATWNLDEHSAAFLRAIG